jgi:hypothetical protein
MARIVRRSHDSFDIEVVVPIYSPDDPYEPLERLAEFFELEVHHD